MKALCDYDGTFKGLIEDVGIYEGLKNGKADWSPNVKNKLTHVTIPYELFNRLMLLDKEVEKACAKAREINNKDDET